MFLLFVLKERGENFISQQEIASIFHEAFPEYYNTAVESELYREDDFAITHLFLELLCTFFGLVESKEQPGEKEWYRIKKDYRKTPLFDEVFLWKI